MTEPTPASHGVRHAGPLISPGRRGRYAAPVIVGVATLACFAPILQNEFVSWDDYSTLVENESFRGLGPSHLKWMFTTFHMGPYQPLSWLTYAIDFTIWGLDPRGFHLTNVLLHAATAVAVYHLARRLFSMAGNAVAPSDQAVVDADGAAPRRRAAAAFAALLFSLHPQRVESVAWATERRDVLCGVLFVGALLAYLRFAESVSRGRRWYAVSLALFVAACLAKAMAVTLPLVLLLLDGYPLRRADARWAAARKSWAGLLVEKAPFLAVSFVIGFVAVRGQQVGAAFMTLEALGPAERIAVAARASVFYLWKMLVPVGLSPFYELHRPVTLGGAVMLASLGVLTGVTVLAFAYRRRLPALPAAWVYYLITLAPVSGLAHAGEQAAADRYTYLPLLGISMLAGAILLPRTRSGSLRGALAAPAAAILMCLAALTVRQIGFWHDSVALWQRVLAVEPDSAFGHYNLAPLLADAGRLDDALSHAERATELKPNSSDPWWGLALVLHRLGRLDDALAAMRRAADVSPPNAAAIVEYGSMLVRAGRVPEAAAQFERALAADPAEPRALLAVGLVRAGEGDMPGARSLFDRAFETGRLGPDAYLDAAAACIGGASPGDATVILKKGVGRFPDRPELLMRLGWILATHPKDEVRRGPEALTLAERAVNVTRGDEARPLVVLAAALAEVRRLDEARDMLARADAAAAGREPAIRTQIATLAGTIAAGRPIRARPLDPIAQRAAD